ncbi:MAG TPA: hypothetical protein VIL58_02280 [Thermoplasmata archaeon]
MAVLDDLYAWLAFEHVLGVFVFLLAHGVSAGVGFKLRREKDHARIGALLDLSASSYTMMALGFLWILATGGILGWLGGWWTRAWFWTAIIVLFVVTGFMTPLVATKYNKVRRALGLRVMFQSKRERKAPPPKPEEVPGFLAAARPMLAAGIGMGGIAIVLWLMMFKPF